MAKIRRKTDGAYENVFLATGTQKDRSARTVIGAPIDLDPVTLSNVYQSDGMAAKIVDIPVMEMLRAGFEIEGVDDAREIMSTMEGLKTVPSVAKALKWAGLFGGALIVMLIDDGGRLDEPLNEKRIRGLDRIRVYDRWQVSRHAYYEDPKDARYGDVKQWRVSPSRNAPYLVHESRCIPVLGEEMPDRNSEVLDGWGGSVIDRVYTELVRHGMSHVWGNALLERAQQGIHKIPGLSNTLKSAGGEDMVMRRVNLVDMARSVNNTVVIDGEEGYDLKSTSLSGVADLMDRMGLSLASVARIPEAILFERQQGGMNSTGQSELERWYAGIAQRQATTLLPIIDRIVWLVMQALGNKEQDYLIKFNPLWVPSDKEKADTAKTRAETAKVYHDIGALDPSEIRAGLAADGEYEIDDIKLNYGEEKDA